MCAACGGLSTQPTCLLTCPARATLRPPRRGAPVEAIAILALLASLVGIYSLPGVAIVCCVVPLQ